MKLHSYPETDSLDMELSGRKAADSREISPRVVVDVDENGDVDGFNPVRASKIMDLNQLEIHALPTTLSIVS